MAEVLTADTILDVGGAGSTQITINLLLTVSIPPVDNQVRWNNALSCNINLQEMEHFLVKPLEAGSTKNMQQCNTEFNVPFKYL